jgi:hypothetical protein
MMKIVGRIAAAVAVLGFLAAPASAQLHDNAVYPAMPGVGVTIAGDVALGLNDDAKVSGTAGLESPMFVGGRVTLGLPMFSVWAGAGMSPLGVEGADSDITFGGGAGYHVLQGPMLPVTVSIQAGLGYQSFTGGSVMNVPFGVLLVVNVPSPIDVKPWIMPRGQLVRVSNGTSESEFGFGASGGLMVTAPMGIGAHVTLDFLSLKPEGSTERFNPMRVSGGLHYKVAVPSLGM